MARGRPGRGALAAAHLPGRRHAAARPLPDRPRRPDRSPTGNGGRRTRWATTSTSARSPRSSPSTWRKPSPRRFGLEWVARDDGHGFEIKGISGQMMRLFSSRRESITADLRARAARFEQQYGRTPSQRELAQLAQASNFSHARGQARHAGCRAGARGLGGQARADPRREPGVGRAVGVARRKRPRGARTHTAQKARSSPELELARAAQKAVALAQQEKSTWTRADVIKYLGRVLPRSGIEPGAAAALLEGLADRALASEFEPVVCLEAPEPAEVPRQFAARRRAQRLPAARRHPVRHARAAGHGRAHARASPRRRRAAPDPRAGRARARRRPGAARRRADRTRARRRTTSAREPGCARTRPPRRCRS